MFKELYTFEIRYLLKQPLFYILFTLFFFITFGATTSDAVSLGGALGNVHRNAPYVIMQFLAVMSVFGVLSTTAYVAGSIHRDIEFGTDALFFSSPLKKTTYLLGRFFGSFTIASAVYIGVVVSIIIGSFMPWIDKDRLGAFSLTPYVFSFFVLVVPTLFLFGTIFFCVAALTRSLMATYASAVGFYVVYGVVETFAGQVENERLASLFDPFGLAPFELMTRYWTVYQKNTMLLPISGVFLFNRLIWIGVAIAFLAIAVVFFDPAKTSRSSRKKKAKLSDEALLQGATSSTGPLALVAQTFGGMASLRQYLHSTKVEILSVVKSVPYLVILFLGVANVLGGAANRDVVFGTKFYPVTHQMLEAIQGGFSIFAILIAAFYSGDIVWRERTIKLNEVHDATPVPTWVIWCSKISALAVAILLTLIAAALTTISYQTYRGFHHLQPLVYANGLLDIAVFVMLIGILGFFAQIITNQKFVGFAVVLAFFVVSRILPAVHLEHRLYRLFNTSNPVYSDLNGWGTYLQPWRWFSLYWSLFGAILLVIGHLYWVRGTESSLPMRNRTAKSRLGRPALATLVLLTVAFASTGCYIYYNTNVLNHYTTADKIEKDSAEYEKLYKKYERIDQPKITDAQADVDIYPQTQAVDIRGHYTIQNKTASPIQDLHIATNPNLTSTKVTIAGTNPRPARILFRR
ncbi:MAG: ABC transporter permease subunit, partial [Acidobacteriota bacterium]